MSMVENYGMYRRKICIGVKNKKSQVFLLDLISFFEFVAKFYLVYTVDIYENCATIPTERQIINSKSVDLEKLM